MAGEPGSIARAISVAAIDLFYKHGYEAATLRDLAKRVGLKVGSLYNHIESKQGLIFSIMRAVMDDLMHDVETAVANQAGPVAQMHAAVRAHVSFHATRAKEVFVGNSELRSLTPAHHAFVVRLRDRYEGLFQAIVEAGKASGAFEVEDATLSAYAILAMCTGVSSWYSPQGRLSVDELANRYSMMALRLLGVSDPAVAAVAASFDGSAAKIPRPKRSISAPATSRARV